MSETRQILPMAGLVATIAMTMHMVVQLDAQAGVGLTANFTNAAVAEVKDAQGQIVLQGQFAVVEEDDDDQERKASLKPIGNSDARGEAEVEFASTGTSVQEVEFSTTGLQPGATYRFVIDGQDVATATADQRGRAKTELEVKRPATP